MQRQPPPPPHWKPEFDLLLGVWKGSGLPREKANAVCNSVDHLPPIDHHTTLDHPPPEHNILRFNRRITEFTVGGELVSGGAFSEYGTSCLDEFVDFEADRKG